MDTYGPYNTQLHQTLFFIYILNFYKDAWKLEKVEPQPSSFELKIWTRPEWYASLKLVIRIGFQYLKHFNWDILLKKAKTLQKSKNPVICGIYTKKVSNFQGVRQHSTRTEAKKIVKACFQSWSLFTSNPALALRVNKIFPGILLRLGFRNIS